MTTRWVYLTFCLLFVVLLVAACAPKPTGVAGHIAAPAQATAPDYSSLQVRVLTLVAQETGSPSARVFLEGEVAATAEIGPDGEFRVSLRPGEYVLKVMNGDQTVASRMIQVKRNRMTRADIELK